MEEIDLRTLPISNRTLPVLLRSMIDKIDSLVLVQDELAKENDTLKESLEFAHNKISDLEKRDRDQETEIDKIKAIVETMESESRRIKVDSQRLREKTIKSESYSRRMNLRFEGIESNPNENNTQCRNKIYKIMNDHLGIEDAERTIVIERCHRDSKYKSQNPPSILAKFLSCHDRERVWNNRDKVNKNRENTIYLNEDFPPEMEKRRAFLRPYVKAAWAMNKRATLIGDTLLVDGNRYTADTLNELPDDIKPEKTVIKTENNITLFYRQDAYLSNSHPSVFEVDGKTYNCCEQFYSSKKAKCFDDKYTENQVLASTNPSEMKFLGNNVKGYNRDIWSRQEKNVMIRGLQAKFSQNEDLSKKLLSTGETLLAEASLKDTFWGTGVGMFEKNAFQKNTWKGINTLGSLLMEVRESLQGL